MTNIADLKRQATRKDVERIKFLDNLINELS